MYNIFIKKEDKKMLFALDNYIDIFLSNTKCIFAFLRIYEIYQINNCEILIFMWLSNKRFDSYIKITIVFSYEL